MRFLGCFYFIIILLCSLASYLFQETPVKIKLCQNCLTDLRSEAEKISMRELPTEDVATFPHHNETTSTSENVTEKADDNRQLIMSMMDMTMVRRTMKTMRGYYLIYQPELKMLGCLGGYLGFFSGFAAAARRSDNDVTSNPGLLEILQNGRSFSTMPLDGDSRNKRNTRGSYPGFLDDTIYEKKSANSQHKNNKKVRNSAGGSPSLSKFSRNAGGRLYYTSPLNNVARNVRTVRGSNSSFGAPFTIPQDDSISSVKTAKNGYPSFEAHLTSSQESDNDLLADWFKTGIGTGTDQNLDDLRRNKRTIQRTREFIMKMAQRLLFSAASSYLSLFGLEVSANVLQSRTGYVFWRIRGILKGFTGGIRKLLFATPLTCFASYGLIKFISWVDNFSL